MYQKNDLFQQVTYDKVIQSSAHAKFAFGKDRRFPNIRLQHESVGYTLPSTQSGRHSTFGYGNRKVFAGKLGK